MDTFNVDIRFTGRSFVTVYGPDDVALADVLAAGMTIFQEQHANLYPFMPEVVGVQRVRDGIVVEQLEGDALNV